MKCQNALTVLSPQGYLLVYMTITHKTMTLFRGCATQALNFSSPFDPWNVDLRNAKMLIWRFPTSSFLFTISGFETPKYLGSLPLKLPKFWFSIAEVTSAGPATEPSSLLGFQTSRYRKSGYKALLSSRIPGDRNPSGFLNLRHVSQMDGWSRSNLETSPDAKSKGAHLCESQCPDLRNGWSHDTRPSSDRRLWFFRCFRTCNVPTSRHQDPRYLERRYLDVPMTFGTFVSSALLYEGLTPSQVLSDPMADG